MTKEQAYSFANKPYIHSILEYSEEDYRVVVIVSHSATGVVTRTFKHYSDLLDWVSGNTKKNA